MNPTEQREHADNLADALNELGFPVDADAILDSLATYGLALIRDFTDVAERAYLNPTVA